MLTGISLHILIQKETATSELTVVTLEKDTICNEVGYMADFAQSVYSCNIQLVWPEFVTSITLYIILYVVQSF